jgi:ribonucleoside-diphosphate reductase beta chain
MEGLIKSNRFIARDEGIHVNGACALYSFVKNRVPSDDITKMFNEANEICRFFVDDAIKVKLIGIDIDSMMEYINYVSDRLLVLLGYEKIYNVKNPFDFMETIGMLAKDNFFENRPDSYQKSHNEDNKLKWEFKRLQDF